MKPFRILLPTFLVVLATSIVSGQNHYNLKHKDWLVRPLFSISAPVPMGVNWEQPISKNATLLLNGGVGGEISMGASKNNGRYFHYRIAPIIIGKYRNYYNIEKRLKNGKNIENNSANFFSFALGLQFPDIAASKYVIKEDHAVGFARLSWGMQRRLSRRFNFSFDLGAATTTNNLIDYHLAPVLDVGFYYLLKK